MLVFFKTTIRGPFTVVIFLFYLMMNTNVARIAPIKRFWTLDEDREE